MLFAQDCQRVALVGLGGVGKTQVALQLAYWVKEYRPEYSIFWIPVLSHATFEEAYAEMGRRLPIQNHDDSKDVKDLVKDYLSSAAVGPWLLVVDNADDVEVLFGPNGLIKYLPESEHGLVLFTTRSREVAIQAVGNDLVDLGEMDRSEAMKFLEKSLIRKDLVNESTANELLEELTNLPLAISQAAAYLNKNQLSISEYLRLLRSTEANMVSLLAREFRDKTRYEESQNAIAATWLVSFEQIRKSDRLAGKLLSFISCIEPKAIPQSILPSTEIEEHLINAIGTLCGYTFLVRRGDSDIFDMHSLVHVAIKVWLETYKDSETAEIRAITDLKATLKKLGPLDRNLWRSYLPHALHLLSLHRDNHSEEKAYLFDTVGWWLYKDRRFTEATACLEMACRWREQHLHERDHDRLSSEHDLALAYHEEGRHVEAIAILKWVVAIQQDILAENDRERLASEQVLGLSYLENQQFEEANKILEHVAAISRRILAEDDEDRLIAEHSLATSRFEIGQIHEALTILRHVVVIARNTLPVDDHYRLRLEAELARFLHENGEVDEAVTLLERIVVISRVTYDEDDSDLLGTEAILGYFYTRIGRLQEAIQLLERVLSGYRKVRPETDRDRLTNECNLAVAYGQDGQVANAAQLLKHVVEVETRKFPDRNPLESNAVKLLAEIYEDDGKHEQALNWRGDVAALWKSMRIGKRLPV